MGLTHVTLSPSFRNRYCSGISCKQCIAKCAIFSSCVFPFHADSYCTNWKLSNVLSGNSSSNCFIKSQGPSPTPTIMMDNGASADALTIAWTVCSTLDSGSIAPSPTITKMWKLSSSLAILAASLMSGWNCVTYYIERRRKTKCQRHQEHQKQ